MQTNIISKLITTADYNRAKFAMRNADSVPVQENMFSSCTATEEILKIRITRMKCWRRI